MPRALGVALLAVVAVLAIGAAAFFNGVELSGEYLRPSLERALSAAFRLPTRLEGPLRLRTGRTLTLAADALVIADPAAGTGAILGRGIRPRARIDLAALLRGTVAIDEVAGERLELALVRGADGRANWSPIFTRSPRDGKPSLTFDGIARLRIGRIAGSYRRDGDEPLLFEITDFDGGLPRDAPITARGGFRSGVHAFAFELRTASLADFGAATAPVRGAIDWSGLRATFDGEFIRDGSRLDARVHAAAAHAGSPLAALGLVAGEPGPLEARLRLNLGAGEVTMRDLDLRVGQINAAGEVGVAWTGTRPRVTARLATGKIDLLPFFAGTAPAGTLWPEVFIDWLQRIATGVDAEVSFSAAEVGDLAVDVNEVAVEARSRDLTVDMKGTARVAGVHVTSSVAYDARQSRRTLAVRIDSGAASTAALGVELKPRGWDSSFAALRGRLDAAGASARSIVASAQGGFEADNLRWSIDRGEGGSHSGRLDRLRVSIQGERVVAVDAAGRIGGGACSLKLSGAALAPLLAGDSWPVRGSGMCPGERFSANGSVALAGGQPNASLAINVAADRPGPIARLLGAGQRLPYPLTARGTLALDASSASITFDALRLGRSSGAGDAQWPRGTGGAARVRLAFTALDLDELGELAGGAPAPDDPLKHEVLPASLPLPDLDFDLTAERVAVGGAALRHARFAGALRSQSLPPAKFRFEWDGMTLAGQFGADFSGSAPRIEIDAATHDIDLRGWLARLGRTDIGLRAAALSLSARAQGARVGELLASATVSGALDRGRLILPASGSNPASAIDFSATLEAAPGKPTRLAAHGAADGGEPIRLSLDAGVLAELAGAGEALPLILRATSGDVRLDAEGRLALDGSGEARVQLSGRRLERLGALIGVTLPAAEPYSARGNLRVAADAIHADELDVAVGRSRLVGSVRLGRAAGGRKLHRASLRATALHLEDVGGDRWLRFDVDAPREEQARDQDVARASAWLLDVLRSADFDLAVEVESLLGADQPLAAGRLTAQAEAGTLRLHFNEVLTAGGEINAELRVDAAATPPSFAVRARARELEYGPMLRALDPSTSLEGGFDFNADLTAQAPPEQVLRELAGTIDAATYPRGLRPRALNLWGVGLVNGLLRQLDSDARSSIDCAVAGFDVERGVARSRGFFVETTRVRIVGELEIDLVTRALVGRIDARSRAPQVLAVAPTMLLGGTADRPRVSAAPRNIVTLPLRFATTLGGLVGDWRSGTGPAQAGPAACREAFELLRPALPAAN
jgi:uncharacterized protein involved in outer membrane biogenesis